MDEFEKLLKEMEQGVTVLTLNSVTDALAATIQMADDFAGALGNVIAVVDVMREKEPGLLPEDSTLTEKGRDAILKWQEALPTLDMIVREVRESYGRNRD